MGHLGFGPWVLPFGWCPSPAKSQARLPSVMDGRTGPHILVPVDVTGRLWGNSQGAELHTTYLPTYLSILVIRLTTRHTRVAFTCEKEEKEKIGSILGYILVSASKPGGLVHSPTCHTRTADSTGPSYVWVVKNAPHS